MRLVKSTYECTFLRMLCGKIAKILCPWFAHFKHFASVVYFEDVEKVSATFSRMIKYFALGAALIESDNLIQYAVLLKIQCIFMY